MRRLLLSLAVAAVLVGLAVYRAGPELAFSRLAAVSLPVFAAALAVQTLTLVGKAWRWKVALRAASGSPVRGAVRASLIGFAGNLVLPARLGEIVRVHLVAQENRLPRSLALTAVGLTQFFDLLLLAGLLLALSFLVATELLVDRRLLLGLLAAGLAGLILLAAAQRRSASLSRWADRASRIWPRPLRRAAVYYVGQFAAGLRLLGDRRQRCVVLLQTLGIWTLEVLGVLLGMAAFDIPADPAAAATLVVVYYLAFLMPLTPGNAGPHQWLTVLVLGGFGVPEYAALAFSLGMQAACTGLVLLLGGLCVVRTGLSACRPDEPTPPSPEPLSLELQVPRRRSERAVHGASAAPVANGSR